VLLPVRFMSVTSVPAPWPGFPAMIPSTSPDQGRLPAPGQRTHPGHDIRRERRPDICPAPGCGLSPWQDDLPRPENIRDPTIPDAVCLAE
jgi:hypothetical protein